MTKKNPLKPPAVQPNPAPANAKALPVDDAAANELKSVAATVREGVRQAVTYANQAQSALRVAVDGARLAQKLADNPLAALGRVPGLLTSVKQVAGPLEKLSPTLSGLSGQLPDVSNMLRASDNALSAVRSAQGALSSVSATTIGGRIDYLSGQLSTATSALQSAAPSMSQLAAKVIARVI